MMTMAYRLTYRSWMMLIKNIGTHDTKKITRTGWTEKLAINNIMENIITDRRLLKIIQN